MRLIGACGLDETERGRWKEDHGAAVTAHAATELPHRVAGGGGLRWRAAVATGR